MGWFKRAVGSDGLYELLVIVWIGASRFERPTTCSQGRCAARLRYAPSTHARP